MEKGFWLERWEKQEIGFHNDEFHPLLVEFLPSLSLTEGARIFLPLCGKTLDIGWLLAQGYRVVGIDLSEIAVRQLFDGLGVVPDVSDLGQLKHFKAEDIDIFAGDIFDLSGEVLGAVDAIYDRAALVALPEEMRQRYSRHLSSITKCAPQLLITLEYDQSLIEGPPFSISNKEVDKHYSGTYNIELRITKDVEGGLKQKYAASEHVYLLTKT